MCLLYNLLPRNAVISLKYLKFNDIYHLPSQFRNNNLSDHYTFTVVVSFSEIVFYQFNSMYITYLW